MNKKFYDVWLSSLEIDNSTKIKLLENENVWNMNEKILKKIGVNKDEIYEILNVKNTKLIEEKIKVMEKQKIDILNITDEDYPYKLRNIENPPAFLYVRGNKENFFNDSVGIVGCRKSTNNGNRVTRKIAKEVADNDITIVSGLAIGIDKYAHLGALDSEVGKTIAVLGSGINDENIYPFENKKVFDRILESGGTIVSEYSVFAKPEGKNFPQRNRIISGLSDKVIVVEAKKRSGALITAEYALDQGRDLYAVPGDMFVPNKEGTNRLIQNGFAFLLSRIDELWVR